MIDNYRPISILSYLSKILEKLMHKRIYKFLIKNNIIYNLQFGFRQNYSTNLALVELLENIRHSLDNGEYTIGLYLDLSKAFDTVNHNILLNKLDHYGIRGHTLAWFESYLTNRKQYVLVDNNKSELGKITTGVPQGSVLGPLLFIIYMNDICNVIKNNTAKLMLFADDTNLFISGKNPIQIKNDMEAEAKNLQEWFKANKLTLSIEKTNFSLFHQPQKKIPKECDEIHIGDKSIKRVNSVKYLGIIIDDKLNWSAQVNQVCEALMKLTSSFKIIKHYVPEKCKRQLYYAYVHSKIKYGLEVYGHTSKTNINKIQKLQNKILKILFNKDWYTPTLALHKELNLLQVQEIFYQSLLTLVHKQRKKLLPEMFNDYFHTRNELNNINVRTSNKLNVIKTNTSQGDKMLKTKGAYLYNSLPDSIISINNTNNFKNKVKQHFISEY